MVQHLEREIELNDLAMTDSPPFTGVNNLELSLQQQREKPKNQQEHASGAATQDICYETVAKPTGTNDPRETKTQLKLHHVKHAEK